MLFNPAGINGLSAAGHFDLDLGQLLDWAGRWYSAPHRRSNAALPRRNPDTHFYGHRN
jgi:hypothetical protein